MRYNVSGRILGGMSRSRSAFVLPALTVAGAAIYALSRIPVRNIEGEVVLIAGGSRGLGLAMAERFARAGAKLVLAARSRVELEQARGLLVERGALLNAENILLVPTDLTVDEQITHLVRQTIAQFGQIDILINNAAIIDVGPFEDQTFAAFRSAMDLTFFAALKTIQAVLPHMRERFESRGEQSAIVNISSIGGKFGVPHLLPYVAAKFALTGFSEGLGAELRHKGIRVTTVCPGLMRTGSVGGAQFSGDAEAEYRWFSWSATTPGIATTAEHAASRIFSAVRRGAAEITITPQAWLGARANGVAPGLTTYVSSLANQYLLPQATGNTALRPGKQVRSDVSERTRKLEVEHNQTHPAAPQTA